MTSYGAQWVESNDLPTTITASGTANTPGSWVEIIASLDADIDFMVITSCANVASGSVNSSQLCDIATGGVGAETIIVSDLNFGHDNGSGSRRFTVPAQIPAGTRISARLQSAVASATNTVLIDCFAEGALPLPFFGTVETLEVDAASSHGNIVHNIGTGSTFTGWTQIIASTAEDYRGFILGIDGQDTNTGANDFQVLQIGIGGSGSEVPVGACFITSTANELVHWRGGNQIWLPEAIPAGSRVSIRSRGYGAQNAFNMGVCLYGIYGDPPSSAPAFIGQAILL